MKTDNHKPIIEQTIALLLYDPPQLSDEMAVQLVEFFHELTHSIENHYGHQLRACYQRQRQLNLKLPFE